MPPAMAAPAITPQARVLSRRGGAARRPGRGGLPFWLVTDTVPPPAGRFIALVPGAEAPLMQVDLPPGLRGPARETVARRQLIDRLGGDLSGMELRPAPIGGAGGPWQAMLMVRRHDLARWRGMLAARGRAVRAILPDYLALPAAEAIWTVETRAAPEPSVQVRLGPRDGFSAEPAIAALTLARALGDEGRPRPRALLRLGPALPALDAPLDAALEDQPGQPAIARVSSPEALPGDLPRPLVLGHGELALDLAQPQRDPRRELEARLRGAVLPVVLLALAATIWAAASLIEIWQLRDEARAVAERNIALVREAFLPSGPLPDIRMQVARLIEDRRAALLADPEPEAERALTRLKRASAVLSDSAPARLARVVVQPDGRIVLDLRLPDFTALETLEDRLRAAGLTVARGAAASGDDGAAVLATLTLQPGPPAAARSDEADQP